MYRIPSKIFDFIRKSTLPLTLADGNAADFPIVQANEAFSRLTGYETAEVCGRNCRFLQGGSQQFEARADIRASLASGENLQIVLNNIRKDGTIFDNLLFLYTINDSKGDRFVLGSQFELKDVASFSAAPAAGEKLDQQLKDTLKTADFIMARNRRQISDSVATLLTAWARERII